MRDFLKRWQEFTGWLPLLVFLALAGWVVFGALDPRLAPDRLSWLLDLPVMVAYALAASGMSYLAWRRWSVRLTGEEICAYWARVQAGERGAVVVFVVNAAFYLAALGMFLWFFYPAR
jgi:hypothetical protein